MEKEIIHFDSADGLHKIAAYIYTGGQAEPKAVIQLSHGMCEYIERYEWLAEFFTTRGYIVAGNDHLGHGSSVEPSEYGIFDEEHVLADLKKMNEILRERYHKLPVILYGHSMGSFFARWCAARYSESIDGLIISGTAGPSALNSVGKTIAGLIAGSHKEGYVSKFLVNLNFKSYIAKIKDAQSDNDWLTHDRAVVEAYDRDSKCQFDFSAKAYHSMLKVLTLVSKREWAEGLPKNMKILQIAGEADPVGEYGAGVRKVTQMLKNAGIEDVTEYIDKEGRHELHNELNKEEIMNKVVEWLESRYS